MTPQELSLIRIRAWLNSGEMTQEDIARKAGVTRMTLFKIRTHRHKGHSSDVLSRIEALIPHSFQTPSNQQ